MVSSMPRPHFTPGKDPVPILQEAGWAPGPVWTGGRSPPHRDSIPDRPVRSQSLYRLSYPVHSREGGAVIGGFRCGGRYNGVVVAVVRVMTIVMVLAVLVIMAAMGIVRIATRKNYTERTRKEIQLILQIEVRHSVTVSIKAKDPMNRFYQKQWSHCSQSRGPCYRTNQ